MKIGETRILLGLCAVLSCARPACAETEPARLDLAMIVLDSSTVPSTPDGSSPAWNAIRAVRRFVDGKTVFWKTTTDRYSYLYWTPDQGKENKVAPGSASWRTEVLWLDVGDEMRGPDGRIRKGYALDGVHLNDAGYRVWLGALREKLKEK